jgi:hypothetical protein
MYISSAVGLKSGGTLVAGSDDKQVGRLWQVVGCRFAVEIRRMVK